MKVKKSFSRSFVIITSFLFFIAFSIVLKVYADPPATPYTPGETLNPTCSPTDTNCTVSISGSSGWGLIGNSGNTSSNFIGNTDNVPLIFKVNNIQVGKTDGTSGNTSFGYQAGQSIATGNTNTAIGSAALSSNTTGSKNVALGTESLFSFTHIPAQDDPNSSLAFGNVAIGSYTLHSNITGFGNVALGNYAGYFDMGSNSFYLNNGLNRGSSEIDAKLKSLIYGKFDTSTANQFVNINGTLGILDASGAYYTKLKGGTQTADVTYTLPGAQGGASTVLTNDGTGVLSWATGGGSGWGLTGNTGTIDGTNFIGTTDNIPLTFKVNNIQAGRIDNSLYNVFWGYQAGKSNISGTTGWGNVAVGDSALFTNTTGRGNIAIGDIALYNSTGDYNVAIGHQSLFADTTGYYNTATGYSTLMSNDTGSFNSAFGLMALLHNTSGGNNTASGIEALSTNTTGSNNVAFGSNTLMSNSIGNNNVALGYQAGYWETGDNNLFIDNQQRASDVDGRLKALIYGKFDADPINQFVTINGKLNVSNGDVYVENSANGIILKSATDSHCARVTLTGASGADALNYADITCP